MLMMISRSCPNSGPIRSPIFPVLRCIDRVTITIVNFSKHTLPVDAGCNWSHGGGIASARDKTCTPRLGGERPKNKDELWKCVEESACRINSERLQMAVMRDPRAVAVSAYYHKLRGSPSAVKGMSVDEFALALLPVICQWVSIRYFLFSELISTASKIFWYDDAKANPKQWHLELFSFVGLRVPESVVSKAADAAQQGGHILGFPAKGVDEHVGGVEATAERFFANEVTVDTLVQMDSVLRSWLPPAVLEHLGGVA